MKFTELLPTEIRYQIYSYCKKSCQHLRLVCKWAYDDVGRYENNKITLIANACLHHLYDWLSSDEIPLHQRYHLLYQLALGHYKQRNIELVREVKEEICRIHERIDFKAFADTDKDEETVAIQYPRILSFLLAHLSGKTEEKFVEEFKSGKKPEDELNFLELILTFLTTEDQEGGKELVALFVEHFLQLGFLATNTLPILAYFYRQFGCSEDGKEVFDTYLECPKLPFLNAGSDDIYRIHEDFNTWVEEFKKDKKRFNDEQIAEISDALVSIDFPIEKVIKLIMLIRKPEFKESKLAKILNSLAKTERGSDLTTAIALIENTYKIADFNRMDIPELINKIAIMNKTQELYERVKNSEILYKIGTTAEIFESIKSFSLASQAQMIMSLYMKFDSLKKYEPT